MTTEDWKKRYQHWIQFAELDAKLRQQLFVLQADTRNLADCFAKNIEFGTGGIRGELGPGTNRINLYTIRKSSDGLARYIREHGEQAIRDGVVIAYDSRYQSAEFALEAAKILGKQGIRVYLFANICPTPILSFAVRHFHAFAGIVITASHNPPEYNGYKVYQADGSQITLDTAARVMAHINAIEDELTVPFAAEQELRKQGLLHYVGTEVQDNYLQQVHQQRIDQTISQDMTDAVTIVFTPLHGTTNEPLARGLQMMGYNNLTIVSEQAQPDPAFSTVRSPNPEEPQAFALAIQYAKTNAADLILGTDPDGDRLGIAVPTGQGNYLVLNGNQIGALLLDYVLANKQKYGLLPANSTVLKTIVTSELGRTIAAHYGVETVDTLTGFKYIGEKVTEYEQSGEYVFQFGYEESNGYLAFDLVRDKDAIQSALLVADLCAACKSQGISLYENLRRLYDKYGFYLEELYSITLKERDGQQKISSILAHLRGSQLHVIAGKQITAIEDYMIRERFDSLTGSKSAITLPQSDLIKYWLEDDSWFCIRPSGTEPKLKIYLSVKTTSWEESKLQLSLLKESVLKLIHHS